MKKGQLFSYNFQFSLVRHRALKMKLNDTQRHVHLNFKSLWKWRHYPACKIRPFFKYSWYEKSFSMRTFNCFIPFNYWIFLGSFFFYADHNHTKVLCIAKVYQKPWKSIFFKCNNSFLSELKTWIWSKTNYHWRYVFCLLSAATFNVIPLPVETE